jgi:glycosyltransferase involved in cell wall biosynthesis
MKIVFLSAIDFKDRSIQVIRKTPEAYANNGWNVRYIVARDNSVTGNYYYESVINPAGIRIDRFEWPLSGLRDGARGNRWLAYFWTRLSALLVIFQLAWHAARALRREPADVIYGYEVHGVLAARLVRLFGVGRQAKFVTRFQGTWLTEIMEQKQSSRYIANFDHVLALRAHSDLIIMTDDGTRGDVALQRLNPAASAVRFWLNGTDLPTGVATREAFRTQLGIADNVTVLLSVSRLEGWKRVDRGIAIAAALQKLRTDFVYIVVGEGGEADTLRRLAESVGLGARVQFVGAIPQGQVFNYMNAADIFLSMYDLSNVGNPLLEAIRMQKLVVTLSNGDTGRWIDHFASGLIYDPTGFAPDVVAADIHRVISDGEARRKIQDGVSALSQTRLWTWAERMQAEVEEVGRLVSVAS